MAAMAKELGRGHLGQSHGRWHQAGDGKELVMDVLDEVACRRPYRRATCRTGQPLMAKQSKMGRMRARLAKGGNRCLK